MRVYIHVCVCMCACVYGTLFCPSTVAPLSINNLTVSRCPLALVCTSRRLPTSSCMLLQSWNHSHNYHDRLKLKSLCLCTSFEQLTLNVIIFSTTLNKIVLGFIVGMETGGIAWEEAIIMGLYTSTYMYTLFLPSIVKQRYSLRKYTLHELIYRLLAISLSLKIIM